MEAPFRIKITEGKDLTLEPSAKNTAKYVVSWIRLDILVNSSADSRVKCLQCICRKSASIVLQGSMLVMHEELVVEGENKISCRRQVSYNISLSL